MSSLNIKLNKILIHSFICFCFLSFFLLSMSYFVVLCCRVISIDFDLHNFFVVNQSINRSKWKEEFKKFLPYNARAHTRADRVIDNLILVLDLKP